MDCGLYLGYLIQNRIGEKIMKFENAGQLHQAMSILLDDSQTRDVLADLTLLNSCTLAVLSNVPGSTPESRKDLVIKFAEILTSKVVEVLSDDEGFGHMINMVDDMFESAGLVNH